MATVSGSLTELETVLKKYAESEETVWLSIEVEIDDYLSDLQQRIQKMVEDLPVEVLQLKRSQSARRKALSQERNETLDELSPFDVFTKRIAQEVFETDEELARKARLEEKFIRIVAEVEEEKK